MQLAAVDGVDKVLDLGCASGYSAAVLGRLAHSVVAVESDAALAAEARARLAGLGLDNVTVLEGALETAGKGRGPYDVIVIEGVVADVSDALLGQLEPEGRLVALIGTEGSSRWRTCSRARASCIASRATFDARLPPLAPARDDSFVF